MNRILRYIRMFRILCKRGGYPRANYLRRIQYFGSQGEHCYLQPWNFGTEPQRVFLGNNVHIASNVTFVNHDITFLMFNYMDKEHQYFERYGDIVIGDNVFVGSNTTMLYDVKIGDNVIIGAGSLVNKNLPDGVIAAGVPVRIIGKFSDYKMRYRVQNDSIS